MIENDYQSRMERLLKASEVAEILNVSTSFVYNAINKGEIRMVQMGSAKRVRQIDLDNYINEHLSPFRSEDYLE